MDKIIDPSCFDFDADGLRAGYYADPPYLNIVEILDALPKNYRFDGDSQLQSLNKLDISVFDVANAEVEIHYIARRVPFTLLAGMPKALAMLSKCTGHFGQTGNFVNTSGSLEVEALDDGEIVAFEGIPSKAVPVLIVRGRYRDIALLKTAILGVLARASRIATNVYETLLVANGKPVFFFSPRYDPPEMHAYDGYGYHIAVQRYNKDYNASFSDSVSTQANGKWWGGDIQGTVSHEAISLFLGDTAELMVKFAELLPLDRIRVALVDFHNDCVNDTRKVMKAFFQRYLNCLELGKTEHAKRYKLQGIRVDTSREMIDKSLFGSENPEDYGPSPRLIRLLRDTINSEWQRWNLPRIWRPKAEEWCKDVKIMLSGGFSAEKIAIYENEKVPVDFYGVGSAFLSNCSKEGTITDFSSGIMRIKIGSKWVDVPKAGRCPNYSRRMKKIDLIDF